MSDHRESLTFEEFVANASQVFAEVESEGESVIIEREGHYFVLSPQRAHARKQRAGNLPQDDPFMRLIGIARSGITDVSENTDAYLARAGFSRSKLVLYRQTIV